MLATLLPGCGGAGRGASTTPAQETAFDRLSADYLDWYFANNPVRSTFLGIHLHDSRMPELSRKAIEGRIEELEEWIVRVQEIDPRDLAGDATYDHRILEYAIRADLLELQEVRGWARNPMIYNRAIADGIASLIDRDFAPLESRLTALMARMEQIPRLIALAEENLTDVPRRWAELAIRSTKGTVRFVEADVAAALDAQGLRRLDPELVGRFRKLHRKSVERLGKFVAWLENDLSPRADGDFRLGKDLFERKLLYEEHIALDADELREINDQAISDYQEWVDREAARIDANLTVAEVMERLMTDHPSPEELLPTARRFVEQARDFVIEREIVTMPSRALPVVRPTPEYARSGFASMSTAGPFEKRASEAYYNITNVAPDWSDEKKQQHLTYFNYPGLLGISVHEAMPGHYVQLLYQSQVPTDLRKIFAPSSLVEGWAHYAEQMMVDEGLGDNDPSIRLGQLRRALQRHARWDAALSMHVDGATVEEAAGRFEKIAHFAPFPALRETKRGTYDPTYLYYALGRMEIFRLRRDYQRYLENRGESFSLRDFHDRFLKLGLPIPLARQAMMPGAASTSSSTGD
jgi:uncharacterized protein (DUF885 family)